MEEARPGDRHPPVDERRLDRFRGAMVGVAVGDALGARFEGHAGLVHEHQLDLHLDGTTAERYTDDTAMSMVVAESLLARDGLDEDHLAAAFVESWRLEPWRGYGGGVTSLFRQLEAGGRWQEAAPAQFGGSGSFGNGAAMRCAPVALFTAGEVQLAASLARRSARVTHTHPLGIEGAALQAAAVAHALGAGPLGAPVPSLEAIVEDADLRAALRRATELAPQPTPRAVAAVVGSGVSALEAVPAAIVAATLTPSFAAALRFAIALGGDTDTVASMAGAIAGARHGLASIPRRWLTRTEGVERMVELADALAGRAAGGRPST